MLLLMNIFQDIKLDANEDLDLSSWDFQIVPSDEQNKEDITVCFQNDWKEFPFIGAAISTYLNSSGEAQKLYANLSVMLKADGFSGSPDITLDNANSRLIANLGKVNR
jgi:hypothetical protein